MILLFMFNIFRANPAAFACFFSYKNHRWT